MTKEIHALDKKAMPKKRIRNESDDGLLTDQLKGYKQLLMEIKDKITFSQLKAALSVNSELIQLYWHIGKTLIQKQEESQWGSKIIERLATDLKSSFPEIEGFSSRNIRFMVQFAREYREIEIVKQLVSQIPWGHNIMLLQKLDSMKERTWYAQKTIENGWSRNLLGIWIENDLYNREGKAITNFKHTLPLPQSDLAQQITRDPYSFELMGLDQHFKERELEKSLVQHVERLLMEFGRGFALVGRQVNLNIDGKDYFLDLLFYHTVLHCYIIVELKIDDFQPEYAGKMNFYLGAVDRLMKTDRDNPSIGLILCKGKSKIEVEIALQDIKKPIGVSEYVVKISKKIPKELAKSLPTIAEIEAELQGL